ncbi:MAG: PAS domain S-box protein [Pseudomonadota bacterium]|nr:PAS domain S-box protein [Pseudomonadota bacterium]
MNTWPPGEGEMARRIRSMNWATTPLGPIEHWPQSLRTALDMVLAMSRPASLFWDPGHIQLYNDAYVAIAQDRHPTLLGAPVAEGWPDAYEVAIRPVIEASRKGRSTRLTDYAVTLQTVDGGTEERVFTVDWSPVRDEAGAVAGSLMLAMEVTERRRAERSLRDSEARHRLLVGSWAQAVWEADPNGVVIADSPSWRPYTGQALEGWLGYGWVNAIHPDDRAYAEQQWREAVAARSLVNAEFRLRSPDGGWRWTNVRAAPVPDAGGIIEKWVGMNIDIDARKRAEMALQEGEERQAFLLKLSDALRLIADPIEIQKTATRLLGEQIQASRVFYVLVEEDEDTATILANYTSGVSARLGRYSLSAFSSFAAGEWRSGRTASTDDVDADPRFNEIERAAYASVSTRAGFGLPLIKGGRLVALLGVNQSTPRHWTDDEKELAREVAERTWAAVERTRAETALRRSEERLRALFESIDEGFSEMQVILDEEGHVVDWLHLALNGNFSRVTGIPDITGRLASEVFPNLEGEWFRRMDLAYRTGEPQRFETELAELGRWFDNYITRLGGEDDKRVFGVFGDITERKLAERTLRESEERQAFLLKLSDTLRGEVEPRQIERTALDLLASHLSLDRAYITTSDYGKGKTEVPVEVQRIDLPSLVGVFPHSEFPESASLVNDGTLVIDDVAKTTQLSGRNRQSFNAIKIGSLIGVGLRKGDSDIFWTLAAAMSGPRKWTSGEVHLMEQAAERVLATIARASAEAALRQSEERFRQFAQASASGLWIRNAETLAMEYVSPAVGAIYGVESEAFLGDVQRWAALIVPEDREAALQHMERALHGEPAVHEFRIRQPNDQAFRWIRNTDFPLMGHDGAVERIGGIAEDVTEAKLAVEHQGVLLAELQHRVRNIMAMIRSMALRTADGAVDVEDYRSLLEGRLMALARVQVLLTREANAGGSLRDIIASEVGAQAHGGDQFELEGPDIRLSPKAVEVLTLAFHELATNALKYGALSTPQGRLRVSWAPFEKRDCTWLALDWSEESAPQQPKPTRRGFGSDLIEGRIPYELGGSGKVVIEPHGAHCRLEFPLNDGESILETDAPAPARLLGGTLDMTDAPDLTGWRVLVVEDDYYMAGDTAAALRGAGAEVLGPCPGEEATFELLTSSTPTHAILDLNLGGGGARFEIAHALRDQGVPFIFLTGYDPEVIPAELADVVRLQKPVAFRKIVEAISRL